MNYLLKDINSYFEETTIYESDSLTIDGIMKVYQDGVDFSKICGSIINQNATYYRDLRIRSGNNLFYSGYQLELNVNNFDSIIHRLESRECLYIFSQIYEAFESYLKKILKTFFEHNEPRINEFPLLQKLLSESENISSMINKLQRKEKNNKKLFWLVRKLSENFKENEKKREDYPPFDYSVWFDLMSDIRHSVVHNRQEASKLFLDRLNENGKDKIYDLFFTTNNQAGKFYITTTRTNLTNINLHFNNLAILFFISLSLEANLDGVYKKIPLASGSPAM